MSDDLFGGYGVEVNLLKDFSVVKESISRIGFAGRETNVLFQSCHIFHKRSRYAIMHFKEMFAFDGKPAEITTGDIARRNTIAELLQQWGLVQIINPLPEDAPKSSLAKIKIVRFQDKANWKFEQKYSIGS